jgi:predicted dehydrogenase
MSPVAIAVIGAGPWGLTLTGAFAKLPQVSVRWICELDEERRARAAAVHTDARVTADADEALRDPQVAAIVVAADPPRHHAIGLRALEANKHLFVEKPLALSVRDAEEIRATACARGRVLAVGHLLLHHPAVRRARQMVTAGLLGAPLTVATTRATPGPPRRHGSAWWALAPHDVSLALHLFDELPSAVSANGDAWGQAEEDNAATAVLRFSGGRTAHIHVARFAARKRRDTAVSGPQATLTFDELAATDQALRLSTPQREAVVVPGDGRDPLMAQCLDFMARVARGDAAGGNGAHAVDVVRVLEAGERSMRQAGAPQPVAPAGGAVTPRPESATSFEAA